MAQMKLLQMSISDTSKSQVLHLFLCKFCHSFKHQAHSRVSLEELLQWSQSFEKLMATKYGPIVYKTYLKTEYSDENIEFWFACEKYKKIVSQRKRMSVAQKLFKEYIQPQAPREINMDSQAREAIIANIQEATQSCFNEAQKIVYLHMERDSYPRFLASEIYRNLLLTLSTRRKSLVSMKEVE